MPANDVIIILQDIEQKLNALSSVDGQYSTEVKDARHQIRELLSNPDSVPEPDEFLIDTLATVAQHFEEDHPVLTEWVSRLSDMFSRIGI